MLTSSTVSYLWNKNYLIRKVADNLSVTVFDEQLQTFNDISLLRNYWKTDYFLFFFICQIMFVIGRINVMWLKNRALHDYTAKQKLNVCFRTIITKNELRNFCCFESRTNTIIERSTDYADIIDTNSRPLVNPVKCSDLKKIKKYSWFFFIGCKLLYVTKIQ